MKVREEYETVIGDGEILRRVFEQLGLHVSFRYEKYREEYAAEDVTIALDETPVGTFVEIEGSEEGIHLMTQSLGRTPGDFKIGRASCRERGEISVVAGSLQRKHA